MNSPALDQNLENREDLDTQSNMNSKQRILMSAKKLFVEKGFDKVSVRNIVEDAQVNLSAISYYFSGKEGLYRECLEEFGQEHLEFVQDVLVPVHEKEQLKEAISKFAEGFFTAYCENPQLFSLALKTLENTSDGADDNLERIFRGVLGRVEKFFEIAQFNNLVSMRHSPGILSSLLIGQVLQAVVFDKKRGEMRGKTLDNPEYRSLYQQHLVELFLNGVLSEVVEEKAGI